MGVVRNMRGLDLDSGDWIIFGMAGVFIGALSFLMVAGGIVLLKWCGVI